MPTELKISQFDSIADELISPDFYILAVRRNELGTPVGNNKITLQQILNACDLPFANLKAPTGSADDLFIGTENGEFVLKSVVAAGGSPGGLTGQLQFNQTGGFGGIDNSNWDGFTLTLPRTIEIGEFGSIASSLSINISALGETTEFAALQAYTNSGRGLAELTASSNTLVQKTFVVDALLNQPQFIAGLSTFDMLHTGNVKTINGESIFGTGDISTGGSGGGTPSTPPAGTGTELQYRDGTNLGAVPGSAWDSSISRLVLPNLTTSQSSLDYRFFGENGGVDVSGGIYADEIRSEIFQLVGLGTPNRYSIGIDEDGAYVRRTVGGVDVLYEQIAYYGQLKTVNNQSINGPSSSNISISTIVQTESSTTKTLTNADSDKYTRMTSDSAKTLIVGTGLTVIGQEFHIRNAGLNNVTITASSTTVNAPAGGTLLIPPRGTVTIKQVGATEFDVIGTTTAT